MMTPKEKYQNLDDTWPDDLDEYAGKLFEDLKSSFTETDWRLWAYARIKATAMHLRGVGMAQEALDLEHECERLYRKLPQEARW